MAFKSDVVQRTGDPSYKGKGERTEWKNIRGVRIKEGETVSGLIKLGMGRVRVRFLEERRE